MKGMCDPLETWQLQSPEAAVIGVARGCKSSPAGCPEQDRTQHLGNGAGQQGDTATVHHTGRASLVQPASSHPQPGATTAGETAGRDDSGVGAAIS